MKEITLSVMDVAEEPQCLIVLAESINTEHRLAMECGGRSLLHARTAGEQLRKAKGLVGKHGNWEVWLENNFEPEKRTAQHYMRIAKNWDKLEEIASARNAQGVAYLGIQRALKLLATPKPEPKLDLLPLTTKKWKEWRDEDEDSEAFPRPTHEVSEKAPGLSRINATEEDGDEYEAEAVDPSFRADLMSDGEIRSFHANFMAVTNRLASLSKDATRLPHEHELLDSIQAHMDDLELGFTAIKEALNRE